MTTFKITVSDGGSSIETLRQYTDINTACEAEEKAMVAAEREFDEADQRGEWTAHIVNGRYAECSLRAEGQQDSQGWAKVNIQAFEGWRQDGAEIEAPKGINISDFFIGTGYAGPDSDGVEPHFAGEM